MNLVLKENLLPFQRRFYEDRSRFLIALWSRQTGKGHTSSFIACADAMSNMRSNWIIASPTERQSMETLDKCKEWAERAKIAFADTEEELTALDGDTRIKAKVMNGKIENCEFSEPFKRELFTPLRRRFENPCTVRIPHAEWIRQDLHGMQVIPSGNDFKFWAPRMSSGHSDGCCALALCARAAGFAEEYVPPFGAGSRHDYDSRSVYGS